MPDGRLAHRAWGEAGRWKSCAEIKQPAFLRLPQRHRIRPLGDWDVVGQGPLRLAFHEVRHFTKPEASAENGSINVMATISDMSAETNHVM